MDRIKNRKSVNRVTQLRSVFLGTTSLYALLLTAPATAQSAGDSCTLPDLSIIGGPISIPTPTTPIAPDAPFNLPSAYFLNCSALTTAHQFNGFGQVVIVNNEGGSVEYGSGDLLVGLAPGALEASTIDNHQVAVLNYGSIQSAGPGLLGRTESGDLVGYNDGSIQTNEQVGIGSSLFDPDYYETVAPLAPGMLLMSGSLAGNGILSDTAASRYFVGATSGGAANAGDISAINSGAITTGGLSSPGVVAISAGGQGGMGAQASANNKYVSVAVGGTGGAGGNGGTVSVTNSGTINAEGLNSMGIKALSVGGGGGSGGTATAQSAGNDLASATFSLAIGGSGGVGGNGEAVTVNLEDGSEIQTGSGGDSPDGYIAGDHSPGVLAQSIGGGGGSGGHAVSLSQGAGLASVAVSVSKGGTGGAGGDGGAVTITTDNGSSIVTGGRFAGGIVAQSIGGGGGSGGTVSSQSDSTGLVNVNVSVGMGGDGGAGGSSEFVEVGHNGGSVTTYGTHSTGILAQSIAGGGGNGGNVVDGADASGLLTVSAHVNMGGNAGNGGTAGNATANVVGSATVSTYGDHASGVVVQSIGGGGGNGGSVHSYSHTTGGGGVTDGTGGNQANSLTFNASVGLGGSGGTGAHAGAVSSGISGTVATYGVSSVGVLAQSVGGGGGNGGNIHAVSTSETVDTAGTSQGKINNSAITATVDIGGAGGAAGNGSDALIALWAGGNVTTNQIRSSGIFAQSVGGGGGNGGYTSSLDVTTSIPSDPTDLVARYASFVPGTGAEVRGNLDASLNLGGNGGGGGSAGTAAIYLEGGTVTTNERQSHGAVAQSVGGGGGMGGHAVANGFVGIGTYSFSAALGGRGGTGGNGGAVLINNNQSTAGLSSLTTHGDQSYGIFGQSIGGGGGSAGSAHLDLQKAPAGLSNLTLGLGLGGSGGTGGNGGSVDVSDAIITTFGDQSYGVMAQSIGGGGGNATLSSGGGATTLSLGGTGGNGGSGGNLTLQNITATTSGELAAGLIVQSIGGGGGHAGVASTNTLLDEAAQSAVTSTYNLETGGVAGNGGTITLGCQSGQTDSDCDISATTSGAGAAGMILQSIGGGGSLSVIDAVIDPSTGTNASMAVGFSNGGDGNSGLISLAGGNSGSLNITTSGDGAVGLVAQSIAGNGGALFTTANLSDVTVTTGTSTSDGKSGGLDLTLSASSISTTGDYAPGLFLQSGNALYTVFAADGQQTHWQQGELLEVSNKQVVNRLILDTDSTVTTTGTQSHGIVMDTYSYYGSTNQPSISANDRSLSMWINGNINVSGSDSWGVMAGNTWEVSTNFPIPQPDNVTTAFTLGADATITAGSGTAGGVKLTETGNLTADINGMINANGGTIIDITAANSSLTLGDPNTDWQSGIFQTYDGNLMVTGNASGGTHNITLNPGTILNGGITVDTSIGAAPNISVLGTIDNLGSDAIALGVIGSGATVSFQDVRGNITSTGNPNDNYVTVTNNYNMHGSISGAFSYVMAAGAAHSLDIDAANNSSDIISVQVFTRDTGAGPNGNPAYLNLNLTSLPTPAFQSVTIIDIANGGQQVLSGYTQESLSGQSSNGWGFNPSSLLPGVTTSVPQFTEQANYNLADFDIDNADNVIQYSYQTSVQDDGHFVVVIDDIDIKLNQPSLQGVAAQIAPLAQAHVDAIKNGSLAPDPTSSIYKTLLLAANAAEGTDGTFGNLTSVLGNLTGTALDPDTQSTTNAQRSATDSMNSCGGTQKASVNPVEQGECAWSSITRTDVELGNAAHNEKSTNLALGWQKAIGAKSFLGVAFGYDDVDIGRAGTSANAERVHAGAIYKYVDGNLFGSASLLATYANTDALRLYSDVSAATVTHTAVSKREALALSSRLRAGYRLATGAFDLTPMVDVDVFLNHQFQYTEQGSGGLETYIDSNTNVLVDVHPRVQLGTHFNLGSASVRLYGEFGQRFALNDPIVKVGLADGLAGASTIEVTQDRESRLNSYAAGLIADLGERFEVRAAYELTDGSSERIERFSFKLAYKF